MGGAPELGSGGAPPFHLGDDYGTRHVLMDVEKARQRLEELDQIDGPQSVTEAQEARRLAQNLRLVERYGVDPKELES